MNSIPDSFIVRTRRILGARWTLLQIGVAALACAGCANSDHSFREPRPDGSYIVINHVAGGDQYVIRHGSVEIKAKCQYSTVAHKGNEKTFLVPCLESLPVGQQLQMTRGAGDWLFCSWQVRDEQWHMGLIVEKENVKELKRN